VNARPVVGGSARATNVPRAGCVSSHPCATSSAIAAITVLRWTCSVSASGRLPGSGSPGLSRLLRIASMIARAICRNGGTRRSRSRSSASVHGRAMHAFYERRRRLVQPE